MVAEGGGLEKVGCGGGCSLMVSMSSQVVDGGADRGGGRRGA